MTRGRYFRIWVRGANRQHQCCKLVFVAANKAFVYLMQPSSRQPAPLCCHAVGFAFRYPQRCCLCSPFGRSVAAGFWLGLRPAGRQSRTPLMVCHAMRFASLHIARQTANAQSCPAALPSVAHLWSAPRWHSQRPHAQWPPHN